MALNGQDMADAVVDALAANGKLDGLSTSDKNAIKADMGIAYAAMVTYITANAQVSTSVNTVVIGTLPSGPVAATGSGSGAGTIS